jgi:Rrf2 family nitric oxide-sensitive transcriptional repressor
VRLRQFTDYSLRVLMYLALCEGAQARIQDVAAAYGISRNHLMKVVNTLAREGLVAATRGKGGGIRLALPSGRISVGHVVRRLEQDCPVECFGAPSRCRIASACRLYGVLEAGFAALYDVLDRTSLAELTADGPALRALLGLPPAGAAPSGSPGSAGAGYRLKPEPSARVAAGRTRGTGSSTQPRVSRRPDPEAALSPPRRVSRLPGPGMA